MTAGFTHETSKGASNEWYTPAGLFEAMDMMFDVDPCAPPGGKDYPGARFMRRTIYLPEDGLRVSWGLGRAFVNPPYSDVASWMARVVDRFQAPGPVAGTAVTLTFNRTETKWAQMAMKAATGVLFLYRRVSFVPGAGQNAGSPGTGSMLCAFGVTEAIALGAMARAGHGVMMMFFPGRAYLGRRSMEEG